MRKLKADEIECRIAQVFPNGCTLLLYKTARVDRAILDEVYGLRWQNDFKVIDGKMYGGIGVYDSELKEWLWRWDCGTESNTEAEKGQASDCFKRAGFKFGIGIELYSAPFIWINAETVKNEKGKFVLKDKYEKFDVAEIGYADNGDINKLKIVNEKKEIVFEMGKFIKKQEEKKKEPVNENIDPDFDIIQGISAINDIDNIRKYYSENIKHVVNKEAFIEACKSRKEKIGNKEAELIY